MKKQFVIICIFFMMFIVGFSGCFESTDDSDEENNGQVTNVTMTMQEYAEDQKLDTDYNSYYTQYQESIDEGDTLYIQGNISIINYDLARNQTNITICEQVGYTAYCETFRFEGNITNDFKKDDEIIITVTIKHVVFTDDGFDYDMEIFEEQWANESYFNSQVDIFSDYQNGFKPMPSNLIEKSP